MMARNNAASTITSTFNIPVRYDQELRTAPQAPNCIGGSGGRFFFWTFGPEKPKIWVEMGIFLSKNHEISGARNHVLDPHRCSKVSNSGFNGLKSSKLALYRDLYTIVELRLNLSFEKKKKLLQIWRKSFLRFFGELGC